MQAFKQHVSVFFAGRVTQCFVRNGCVWALLACRKQAHRYLEKGRIYKCVDMNHEIRHRAEGERLSWEREGPTDLPLSLSTMR